MTTDPKAIASALLQSSILLPRVPTAPQVPMPQQTAQAGFTVNALNGQIQQWPSMFAAQNAALANHALIHVTPQNIDNIPNMPNDMYLKLKAVVR